MWTAISRLMLAVCLLAFMLSACSRQKSPAVPATPQQADPPQSSMWGAYELALDATGGPVLQAIDERTGQLVVDPYVQVDLLETNYDPATRIWDIHARFTNKTRYTAFGLWVAFYNLNGNRILGPDGFATPERGGDYPAAPGFGQRKPVVAIGKDQERRRFLGGSSLEGQIRIQWPQGATNFGGLRFYLDASFPTARQEPIVENLTLEGTTISALVIDWQANNVPLQVNAFFPGSPLPVLYSMNDIGEAPDAIAGDNIWSGTIPGSGPQDRLVVRADDSAGFHFENEIGFNSTPEPCSDGAGGAPFRPLVDGPHSAILQGREQLITNPAEWQQLWAEHQPGSAPPPVNFQCFNVYAVFMGSRPTSGYAVLPSLMPHSSLLPELCYSTVSPGAGCGVQTVMTSPFRMWLGPKWNAVAWRQSQRITECGLGNVPFQTLFHGTTPASGQPPRELMLQQPGQLQELWQVLQVPGPVPCVDFATERVLVVSVGSASRQGYNANIIELKANPTPGPGIPLERVDVGWEGVAPGANCETPQIINTPVHIGVIPFTPAATFDRRDRQAPPCEPQACEPFQLLIQNQPHFKEGAYQQLITNIVQWEQYWLQAFPNVPRPPVNFEQQSVVAMGVASPGRRVVIDCIRRTPNGVGGVDLEVVYTIISAGENCPPFVNQQYAVAAFNRFNGNVRWTVREEQGAPCPPPACEPFEVVVDRQVSYKDGPYRLLITNQEQWNLFWQEAYPNEPPAPEINFQTRSLLAISPGAVSLNPHQIRIDCILRPATPQLIVEYTQIFPGANCGTPGFWRPLKVVSINKFAGEVEWRESMTTAPPCPPLCTDFRLLSDGRQSEQFGPAEVVIRDGSHWQQYWTSRYPGSAPPPVNFEQEMVLAINVGVLAITRQPVIDCVKLPEPGTEKPVRVDWHRDFYNAECPFDDGNWSIVVAIPRVAADVEFIQADDQEYHCP